MHVNDDGSSINLVLSVAINGISPGSWKDIMCLSVRKFLSLSLLYLIYFFQL